MLAQTPRSKSRYRGLQYLFFLLLASAIFAIPMLVIVPVSDLLAQGESPDANTVDFEDTAVEEEQKGGSPQVPPFEFLPEPTEYEKAIEVILSKQLEEPIDLPGVSLKEIAELLSKRLQINIHLDEKSFESDGLGSSDSLKTDISISSVNAETLLKLVLQQHGLTYHIKNNVLYITTEGEIESQMNLYIYPVGDLAPTAQSLKELTGTLEMMIAGLGSDGLEMKIQVNSATRSLIIKQNYQGHLEVLSLLRNLRKVASSQSYPPYPPEQKSEEPASSRDGNATGGGPGGGGFGGGGFG